LSADILMNKFDHIAGKHLLIGDAKIYYEERGEVDKAVLLLLHGGFGNMEDFNSIVSKIEKEFRVIGIDSRGQGKSTLGSKKLSYEIMQADVEKVLEHLNINELNVIGFSDGGIVAYRLAVFTTLKIKKLVTIGSRWHKNNVIETREILGGTNAQKWRERFPGMVAAYERLNPEPDFNKLVPELVEMWVNESSYPNENVKNITAETLIIRGDKDHLVLRKFVFEAAEQIESANLSNIPFAGHAVHIDQPEILALTINKFLK